MPEQPFVSFAQNGEDVVLARALRDVERGRYIDVGANHPLRDSVSRGFYDRGWRGLTVEPLPHLAALHRLERPGDILFEGVASTAQSEQVTLHVYDDDGLSTTVDDVRDQHLGTGRVATDIDVASARLDALLEEAGWQDEPIHFMSVDTEGAEADVLASIDLRRWRPWVLVLESTRPNSVEQTHGDWEPAVLAQGYRFCLFDGLSRFYVAEEHAELAPALSYPACVLDGYESWHLAAARRRLVEVDEARESAVGSAVRWRSAALTRWAESLTVPHETEAELERLRTDLAQVGQLAHLRAEELEATRRTLSWRVTRPLRTVRGLGRRA